MTFYYLRFKSILSIIIRKRIKFKVTGASSDGIPLHATTFFNGDIIVVEEDLGTDYVVYVEGKEGDKYTIAKAIFDGLNYFEEVVEANQEGGKRRKHRKTRHRKMKHSKTTKRKVRR